MSFGPSSPRRRFERRKVPRPGARVEHARPRPGAGWRCRTVMRLTPKRWPSSASVIRRPRRIDELAVLGPRAGWHCGHWMWSGSRSGRRPSGRADTGLRCTPIRHRGQRRRRVRASKRWMILPTWRRYRDQPSPSCGTGPSDDRGPASATPPQIEIERRPCRRDSSTSSTRAGMPLRDRTGPRPAGCRRSRRARPPPGVSGPRASGRR